MEAYNHQALDFTTGNMFNTGISSKEDFQPILDLSCKKSEQSHPQDLRHQQTPPSSCTLSPHSRASNSPTMENPSQLNCHDPTADRNYADDRQKSPFAGRSSMVTPPSETDSPKKMQYEPDLNQSGGSSIISATDSINNHFPLLPMGLPLPGSIPTILPGLLANQNVSQPINALMQLPLSVRATSSPDMQGAAISSPLTSPDITKKKTRPFKAYPKDPLTLAVGSNELMFDSNSNEAYNEFRKRMLNSVKQTNEGTNIKMRRFSKSPVLPTSTVDDKDAAYWERRKKNNEAAKRSRDARRAKEDEIAIRAAFLEQENMKLKYDIAAARNEIARLRCLVYSN